MKRKIKGLICCFLVIALSLFPVNKAVANDVITKDISDITVDFLKTAMSDYKLLGMKNIQGEDIYICNPMHPHYLKDGVLVVNSDIEYYLLKTSDEYFACITLCYQNDSLLSASFSTEIANILEENQIGDELLFVAHEGELYVKTEESVINGTNYYFEKQSRNINQEDVLAEIKNASGDYETLEAKEEVQMISSYDIMPRASRILNVPYVSQDGYNVCWAAAAASLGRYYTGSTYAQYSAYDLACIVGVGNNAAYISDSRNILSSVFKISTTYVDGQLSSSQIINFINTDKPMLAAFRNSNYGHMVVVCGFVSGTSSTQYYVRDSNYSSLKLISTYSSGAIALDYYSSYGIMYWDETAYKS